jgi:hypothetical protein
MSKSVHNYTAVDLGRESSFFLAAAVPHKNMLCRKKMIEQEVISRCILFCLYFAAEPQNSAFVRPSHIQKHLQHSRNKNIYKYFHFDTFSKMTS